MLGLPVNLAGLRDVLCLGAHCDDIEIGCGATLAELQREVPGVRFHWVVFSSDEERESETRRAAQALLGPEAVVDIQVARFRGSFFPGQWAAVKEWLESLRARFEPGLVLTHCLEDRHQDHRVVAELTWNAFRDHPVLEYEIPKFEGDLGRPNLFVPVGADAVERKIATLMECFPSQRHRSWFRAEVFRSLMTLRGVECNAASGFAEAFHSRKFVLQFTR